MDKKQKQLLKEDIEKIILENLENGELNEGFMDWLRHTKGKAVGLGRVAPQAYSALTKPETGKIPKQQTDINFVALGYVLMPLVKSYKKSLLKINKDFIDDFDRNFKKYTKDWRISPAFANFQEAIKKSEDMTKSMLMSLDKLETEVEFFKSHGKEKKEKDIPTKEEQPAKTEEYPEELRGLFADIDKRYSKSKAEEKKRDLLAGLGIEPKKRTQQEEPLKKTSRMSAGAVRQEMPSLTQKTEPLKKKQQSEPSKKQEKWGDWRKKPLGESDPNDEAWEKITKKYNFPTQKDRQIMRSIDPKERERLKKRQRMKSVK